MESYGTRVSSNFEEEGGILLFFFFFRRQANCLEALIGKEKETTGGGIKHFQFEKLYIINYK